MTELLDLSTSTVNTLRRARIDRVGNMMRHDDDILPGIRASGTGRLVFRPAGPYISDAPEGQSVRRTRTMKTRSEPADTPSPEDIAAYQCQSCDTIVEEPADDPIHDCRQCGNTFVRSQSADGESNRCPECNRFAAKTAHHSCPECEGELQEVEARQCPECNQLHLSDQEGCPEQDNASPNAPDASPRTHWTRSPTGNVDHDIPAALRDDLYIHHAADVLDLDAIAYTDSSIKMPVWTIRSKNPEITCEITIQAKQTRPSHEVSCSHCGQRTPCHSIQEAVEYINQGQHLHGKYPAR